MNWNAQRASSYALLKFPSERSSPVFELDNWQAAALMCVLAYHLQQTDHEEKCDLTSSLDYSSPLLEKILQISSSKCTDLSMVDLWKKT